MPQQLALPESAACPARACAGQREHFRAGDPGRAGIEAFIAQAFLATYGARISHFCDVLIGCCGDDGAWSAALGYSLAQTGPLFLEHYLDAPLEVAIGQPAQFVWTAESTAASPCPRAPARRRAPVGSYYDTQPLAMLGDMRYGHEKLARLFGRQSRTAQ